MEKSFDFGKLLQNHEKKHKSKPSQFVSVALGVKKRMDKCNKKRRSSRLTIFDKIRNIPKCESPVPKTDPKSKLEHRMKQLEKWKEEKQKKKIEAAAQKKKPFVAGIAHNTLKFVPPPPPKPMPSTSGRVTRSQTTRNNIEKVKVTKSKSTKSEPQSFAPKNAKFNPALNHIVKLPLDIPRSETKKGTSKLNLDKKVITKSRSKSTSKPSKTETSKVKSKTNESVKKNRVSSENFVSESSSSVDSSTMSPVQKQKTPRKSIEIKKLYSPKNSIPKSKSGSDENRNVKQDKVSSKNLVYESSSSVDSTIMSPVQKQRTPRKSIGNKKLYTPKNSVPKSESGSEEKLRSPRLPADVSMTPEQIVEAVQKLPSPCVTMSRGKDNARKEMKKKIDEGLLDDDVCEMDSLDNFKQQLDSEIKRMTEMCNMWDKISEQVVLPEAVQEAVLGAVGQARLLMSQKLQQFATLLARAERPEPGAALVTPTDLHGFWDMVFMQVENIDMRFKKLEEMRARNWAAEPAPCPAPRPAPRVTRPARAAPRAGVSSASAPASRLRDLIAAKRKEKQAQNQNQEGLAPEIKETKTFEAGFFSVRSPVRARSPAPARSPAARASATPRRSLLHAVLSSEAKRASTSKNNASFAMLRASLIGKNVDNDESLFSSNPVPLTPVNLCATPARSILKSVNSKSTRKSGKKSIKVVLFDSTEADMQNISTYEKLDLEGENTKETEEKKEKENERLSMEVEKGVMDARHKPKLVRQDAIEDRSPVMTRSRRKSIQTPLLEEKTEKTPRRTRRKQALQEIEVNVIDDTVKAPKRSSRRKSSIAPVD